MQRSHSLTWALLASLLVGCSEFEPFRKSDPAPEVQEAAKWVETRTVKNAREARAETPEPVLVEAPAPVRTDLESKDWTRTVQALPTGDVATSALLLEKLAPREVVQGVDFEYQLLVSNLTDVSLEQVVIIEHGTTNLVLRETEPAASIDASGAATWALGTLAPKEQFTILVRAAATGGIEVVGMAQATYLTSMRSTIAVVVPILELEFHMPAIAGTNEDIPLELSVRNAGTGAARDILLQVNLPAGLVTEHGDSHIAIPVGTLGAGDSKTLMVVARAPESGDFQASASASMRHGEAVLAPTRCITVQQAVLAIDVSGPSKAFLGRPSRWTLRISNSGDGEARQVVLQHLIPVGMSFVESSVAPQQLGDKLVWNLGSLPAGNTKSIELYLQAEDEGTARILAQVSGERLDPLSDTEEISLGRISALRLAVRDQSDPVLVGETLTYDVHVTNEGSAPGQDIRVVVTLDEGMTLVNPQGPTAGVLDGQVITFEPLESLAAGATATWQIAVRSSQEGDQRLGASMTSARLTRPVPATEATHFHK
ncbi:MAG: putative repeat protein (TIGR01451 family) [Planctomycetota bacterium]|jgi:uncharacterized repeat protein (TIGR01451 family)